MLFRFLADLVALVHGAFVLFVVLGAILVVKWRWLAWLHVPAAIWGVMIEVGGWVCPLTPLENVLRARAGEAGYGGGFVEHYVFRALYPEGLTRGIQLGLAAFVLVVNVAGYGYIWRTRKR